LCRLFYLGHRTFHGPRGGDSLRTASMRSRP
jgi:hypothetical protein